MTDAPSPGGSRSEPYDLSRATMRAKWKAGIARGSSWFQAIGAGSRALRLSGLGLLLVWVAWMGLCFSQQPLPRLLPTQPQYLKDRITYIPVMPLIGLDFHHNYAAVRTWRAGRDPYVQLSGDPVNALYVYSPLVLSAFFWVDLFPPGPELKFSSETVSGKNFTPTVPGILTWFAASLLIVVLATWKSWRVRGSLELAPLPFPFLLGLVLFSYPVIFELERGNCDVLAVAALALALAAMRRCAGSRGDAVVGLCVAFAIGIKLYAIVLLPGLFVLRRYRAAAWTVVWLLVGAIVFSPSLRSWILLMQALNRTDGPMFPDFSHSVIGVWSLFWRELGMPSLSRLPATLTVTVATAAYAAGISWRVWRDGCDCALAWPYLLWLTAWGTLLLPISNDYNLIFIPLAVLAVWSPRDPNWVQGGVMSVALWCQPFFVGLTNLPWLVLKIAGLAFVGILVVRRLPPTRHPA